MFIKYLRVQRGYTWRMIAYKCAEKWPDRGLYAHDQMEGRDLCNQAADVLGEDASIEPWN